MGRKILHCKGYIGIFPWFDPFTWDIEASVYTKKLGEDDIKNGIRDFQIFKTKKEAIDGCSATLNEHMKKVLPSHLKKYKPIIVKIEWDEIVYD